MRQFGRVAKCVVLQVVCDRQNHITHLGCRVKEEIRRCNKMELLKGLPSFSGIGPREEEIPALDIRDPRHGGPLVDEGFDHALRKCVVDERRQVLCAEPPFPDVACDSWARKYIAYCKNVGIVGGYEDGLYHPERPVARDQLAVFIARALAGSDAAVPDLECTTPPFPDVPCNFWARRHIVYCKDRGIVAGYPDGFYYPGGLVSRDQMAVFVSRAFGLVD